MVFRSCVGFFCFKEGFTISTLATITNAKKALAEAKDLNDIVKIRDQAEAIRIYIRAAGEGLQAQNLAAEIKLRAERKAGELLAGMEKNQGRKKVSCGNMMLPQKLSELGISKIQSSRWQQEAAIPDGEFEQIVAQCKEEGEELTQAMILRHVKEKAKQEKKQQALHSRNNDKARKTAKLRNRLFEIRKGDFRDVLQDVEGVSLVLTDPPYGKEYLNLWRDLGKWASQSLADDGILIAYSGQLYLPQVLSNLSESLEYWWCGAVIHKGTGNLTPLSHPVRKVINCWKPLVMFYKKGGLGFDRTFKDIVEGVGPQKTDHNWQQPVEEAKILVEAFTQPGELVVDPFAGSGGFCKAAKQLGRIAIGAEIITDERMD